MNRSTTERIELVGDSGLGQFFQLLRDGGPRTRAFLAAQTGLARGTVANRVDELVRIGLIAPVGDAASTGGRPSAQFALSPTSRLVLAADLGATHGTLAVIDLNGHIVVQERGAIDIGLGPELVLDWAMARLAELLVQIERPVADVLAIGLGVPGPVDHKLGVPTNPPIMPGWGGFDIPAYATRYFDVPVLVDNDVNLMAIGEHSRSFPEVDHFLLVKVATGIGAGIIADGRLQRGTNGVAGDIGHMCVASAARTPCVCGNRGCLEAVASRVAVMRELREEGREVDLNADIKRLVDRGDLVAIRIVREAGRRIGEVLSQCVSVLNPAVIAVGGSLASVGDHLLAGVREEVYSRSSPFASGQLQIVSARYSAESAVIGAGILAVDHALSPRNVDALAQRGSAIPTESRVLR